MQQNQITNDYKGLETVNCCICGPGKLKPRFKASVQEFQKELFEIDQFQIVQCENCGLTFVNPRISEDANKKYYQFELPEEQTYLDDRFGATYSFHDTNISRYLRLIKKLKPSGKMLDIGSGNGYFLHEAEKAGYSVIGQDISKYFVNLSKKNFGLNVHLGELTDLQFPQNSFDIITLFDVIEHAYHPDILLSECRRILKKDGILVITTHDFGNIFARIYGKKWRMVFPIGHVYYFTQQTLARLLTSCGFKTELAGMAYVVDTTHLRSALYYFRSIVVSLLFRSLVIFIYKPLTQLLPFLKRWKIKIGNHELRHDNLLFMAGNQIIANDQLISISKPVVN